AAVRAAGKLGKIGIGGTSGTCPVLKDVWAGNVYNDVFIFSDKMGVDSLNAAVAAIGGKKLPKVSISPHYPVTKPIAKAILAGRVAAAAGAAWLPFALLNPFFLAGANLGAILTQSSSVAIIAAGLTVVIIAGEIDLSIGAVQAVASSVSAVVIIHNGAPWFVGVVFAIAIGAVAGLIT